jgi:hypothetical protein
MIPRVTSACVMMGILSNAAAPVLAQMVTGEGLGREAGSLMVIVKHFLEVDTDFGASSTQGGSQMAWKT